MTDIFDVLRDPEISQTQKLAFMVVALECHPRGISWATADVVAHDLSLASRTVKSALDYLVSKGYLKEIETLGYQCPFRLTYEQVSSLTEMHLTTESGCQKSQINHLTTESGCQKTESGCQTTKKPRTANRDSLNNYKDNSSSNSIYKTNRDKVSLAFKCTACGAQPGEICTGTQGVALGEPHFERLSRTNSMLDDLKSSRIDLKLTDHTEIWAALAYKAYPKERRSTWRGRGQCREKFMSVIKQHEGCQSEWEMAQRLIAMGEYFHVKAKQDGTTQFVPLLKTSLNSNRWEYHDEKTWIERKLGLDKVQVDDKTSGFTEEHWINVVERYLDGAPWPADMGPRPDEDGFLGPEDLKF